MNTKMIVKANKKRPCTSVVHFYCDHGYASWCDEISIYLMPYDFDTRGSSDFDIPVAEVKKAKTWDKIEKLKRNYECVPYPKGLENIIHNNCERVTTTRDELTRLAKQAGVVVTDNYNAVHLKLTSNRLTASINTPLGEYTGWADCESWSDAVFNVDQDFLERVKGMKSKTLELQFYKCLIIHGLEFNEFYAMSPVRGTP
jgi:hypothetical protein